MVLFARDWLEYFAFEEQSWLMEFSIPLCREDLLNGGGKGDYAVRECLLERELTARIDGNELPGLALV